MTITLYSGPLSLFARKVEIALLEKGLAFEHTMVAFSQNEGYSPKHPDVVAANPKQQVPVLVDGDLTIFDSTLIFEYLEDAYPDPALYPRDAKAKARCRQAELMADEVLVPQVVKLMHRSVPRLKDPQRLEALEAEARTAEAAITALYARFDVELADREYFCGAFTVADIAMVMAVLFARRLGAPPVEEHGNLARWFARMRERPAVAATLDEVMQEARRLATAQ
jgi:glutathione S-transferase